MESIARRAKLSFAFSGAFFAWPYHAGVAAYAQQNGLVRDDSRIYGTSSGAIVAMMLTCGVDIEKVGVPRGLEANAAAMNGYRTPYFHPKKVIPTYFRMFGPVIPADGHERATDRLHVQVRTLPRMRQRVVSQFADKQTLLDTLAASIAVPGMIVKWAYRAPHLGWCIDGGFEAPDDDRPGFETISVGVRRSRVSRRARPYDIRPSRRIPVSMHLGLPSGERRMTMFRRGFADAARYFTGR